MDHIFLFTPGEWIGYGKIIISGAKEEISFITKWKISEIDQDTIYAEQLVEKQGVEDVLLNQYRFSNFSGNKFKVALENDILEQSVFGEGKFDESSIIWVFQSLDSPVGLNGVEMYYRQKNDEYSLKAEYVLDDEHKTVIEGHIWRKNESGNDREL